MKRQILSASIAALTLSMAACGGSKSPEVQMTNDVDSLSYDMGYGYSQQAAQLFQRLAMEFGGADSAAFIKGVLEAYNHGADSTLVSYLCGLDYGVQCANMLKSLDEQVFPKVDSTRTLNHDNFVAGFIDGINGKDQAIAQGEEPRPVRRVYDAANKGMERMIEQALAIDYAENKAAGEAFMAKIANEEGIQELGKGVFYRVITEGKGEIPQNRDKVTLTYEGRFVNDSIFDTSFKNGDNPEGTTSWQVGRGIPGFDAALKAMPVGSEWEVYIPYDQAYGSKRGNAIEPYTALIFKIKLVSIDTDKSKAAARTR